MADVPIAPTPEGTPAPRTKPSKPMLRRESQRERERKERDSISEMEETFKRIASHRGIIGVLLANGDGIPLKSTLDEQLTLKYVAFIIPLAHRAKIITKSHDVKDEVTLLRIRTRTSEIIVTSERDFYLVVAQKTSFLD